jgi:hypothetical protein
VLYGKMVPFADVLNGQLAPADGSEPFLAVVRKYTHQASVQGKVNRPAAEKPAAAGAVAPEPAAPEPAGTDPK